MSFGALVTWEQRIRPLAAALLTGGLCMVVASAGRTSARKGSPADDLGNLPSKDALFSFDAHRGELKVQQGRGKPALSFSLSHVIDGAVRPARCSGEPIGRIPPRHGAPRHGERDDGGPRGTRRREYPTDRRTDRESE